MVEELINDGLDVIVLDNLGQGHPQAVPREAEFVLGDIRDRTALDNLFASHRIDAVMHMAAETLVELSVTDPKRHFDTNLAGGLTLLDAMLGHGVNRLIFSSTAAVYGEPHSVPIDESHPAVPINAYGESKLMLERVLAWYGRAYGLRYVCMRYFNAAGATERVGEDHDPETHLIPNILRAALDGSAPVNIFGSDYPTPDGTCVRDYVHVSDIARAHILGLEGLESLSGRAYNLGSAMGYSILEVLEATRRVTGVEILRRLSPRRAGDPAVLVASSALAREELGWEPEQSSLDTIIATAWAWMQSHPEGYVE